MALLKEQVAQARLVARYPLRVGRLVVEELRYPFRVRRWADEMSEPVQTILRDLATQGYHRLDAFWDDATIQHWQRRIDAYCARPDIPERYVKRRAGGVRWLRLERGLPELASVFVRHPLVWAVATAYHRRQPLYHSIAYQHSFVDPSLEERREAKRQVGCGRESYIIGLGREGFHIDDADYGLKAALFLTDVGMENGPLTYCPGTHRVAFDRFTFVKEAKLLRYLIGLNTMRLYFRDDDAERLGLNGRALPFTGTRGTLVLFETRGFHRAAIVMRGERKVLWGTFGSRDRDY